MREGRGVRLFSYFSCIFEFPSKLGAFWGYTNWEKSVSSFWYVKTKKSLPAPSALELWPIVIVSMCHFSTKSICHSPGVTERQIAKPHPHPHPHQQNWTRSCAHPLAILNSPTALQPFDCHLLPHGGGVPEDGPCCCSWGTSGKGRAQGCHCRRRCSCLVRWSSWGIAWRCLGRRAACSGGALQYDGGYMRARHNCEALGALFPLLAVLKHGWQSKVPDAGTPPPFV